MLKFFEVEESSQKVILLITSQEFNKVPRRRGSFLSRSDPLSYEDLEIPAVCVSLVASRPSALLYIPHRQRMRYQQKTSILSSTYIKLHNIIRMNL